RHVPEPETPVSDAAVATAFPPVPRTRLIGRDDEMTRIGQRLTDPGVRLLCITGVGGSGKTRLALAVAETMQAAWPGGVVFIDLAAVGERGVLIDMLADVFNVRRIGGQSPLEALTERVRSRLATDTLLVLDNMEGVL